MNSLDVDINKYDYFLIVDLESTCCDKQSIPKGEHEIIEIGAVMVDADDLVQIDSFTCFIRPVRHPKLTNFCTDLTSIKQCDVDNAYDFKTAINHFAGWLASYTDYLFCSWGNYDRNHLASDCVYYNIANPIKSEHLNIKKAFAKKQNTKSIGMQKALQLIQQPLVGTHHRGIDDASNMVKLLPYSLGFKEII